MPSSNETKWNSKSEDGKLLNKLLMGGEITESDKPGDVYKRYPAFHKYGKECFWSNFNRARAKTGLHLEQREDKVFSDDEDVKDTDDTSDCK